MKKNLLKLLTLVLALVMVVTVFAGCKKADEETARWICFYHVSASSKSTRSGRTGSSPMTVCI